MKPRAQEAPQAVLPVAIAAVDVAGQVRERNPADRAIFGDAAVRLMERFADRALGQQLLARAVSDGGAEGGALLVTGAGRRRFRVSLWRQRGGERIRIVAVFAAECEEAESNGEPGLPTEVRRALIRASDDLRSPLAAVMGFAEMIRADPAGVEPAAAAAHAGDIVAAAWRLMRIAGDLEAAATKGAATRLVRPAEVDIARLARRVARLAAPVARSTGTSIGTAGLPGRGNGPLVLGDEGTLWSAIDMVLQAAIRHGGRGGAVEIALRACGQSVELALSASNPVPKAPPRTQPANDAGVGFDVEACHELALANGAEFELEMAPGQAMTARIIFPAARCLNPV